MIEEFYAKIDNNVVKFKLICKGTYEDRVSGITDIYTYIIDKIIGKKILLSIKYKKDLNIFIRRDNKKDINNVLENIGYIEYIPDSRPNYICHKHDYKNIFENTKYGDGDCSIFRYLYGATTDDEAILLAEIA